MIYLQLGSGGWSGSV